jgi:hypothetical protein
MSRQYNDYLLAHKANTQKAFNWLAANLPDLIKPGFDYEWQLGFGHDQSKTDAEEYDAYDKYFYGNNKSYSVVQNFNKAWLHHLHHNPHHWQYWVLIADGPDEPEKVLEMPYNYVVEMVCDWWSFSWSKNDLRTIFTWWDEHKDYIRLHEDTRKIVENILSGINDKLDTLQKEML